MASPTTGRLAPIRPAAVTPLSPERYKVQFTVSREAYDMLRRAQDLLRHVIPNGDPAAIFARALSCWWQTWSGPGWPRPRIREGLAGFRPAPGMCRRR